MTCAECGFFLGDPTCGACRAVGRIGGLLRSGQLRESQQRRVTEILRGAAGELSDLVELNQGAKEPESSLPEKEDTSGLTSGPVQPPVVGAKKGSKQEESDYSYVTDEDPESEEEVVEDTGGTGKETGAEDTTGKCQESPPLSPETRDKKLAERRSSFDPNYLTKRLCLTPAPKPISKGRASGGFALGKDAAETTGDRHAPGTGSRGSGDWGHDEESEGRAPLPRRPQKPPKKAKKSKGEKRRQRTREFRAKKIEERKARKAKRDRECPRKPKRKGWGDREQWQQ